jgi:hypothetical protein
MESEGLYSLRDMKIKFCRVGSLFIGLKETILINVRLCLLVRLIIRSQL